MKLLVWSLLPLVALVAACSGGGDNYDNRFEPIDYEPGYTERSTFDNESLPVSLDFPRAVRAADAVAVVEVHGIDSTVLHPSMGDDIMFEDENDAAEYQEMDAIIAQTPMYTTYEVAVSEWLVGHGPTDLLVTGTGGVMPDGEAVSFGLSNPLAMGHKYLLLLEEREGEYWYLGPTSFDLTDGFVEFREMPSDEFIDYVAHVASEVADWPICPLHPGDRVESEEFGEGLVLSCKDLGGDYEMTVSFNEGTGLQPFALSEVPLEKIDRAPD